MVFDKWTWLPLPAPVLLHGWEQSSLNKFLSKQKCSYLSWVSGCEIAWPTFTTGTLWTPYKFNTQIWPRVQCLVFTFYSSNGYYYFILLFYYTVFKERLYIHIYTHAYVCVYSILLYYIWSTWKFESRHIKICTCK